MLRKGKNKETESLSPGRDGMGWALLLLWLGRLWSRELGPGSWSWELALNESGHAAEEEGEHVQVGEAGKINRLTRVRGGLDA
jgi:hypothetical protein